MVKETLTHKDLATMLAVSETTIKSYRRKFPEFIPVFSRGKPIHFPAVAAQVCRAIQDAFQRDLSVEETRAQLAERFPILKNIETLSISVDKISQQNEEDRAALPTASLANLDQRLRDMALAQEQTNLRLGNLHELFANYLTLHLGREDAFTRGIEQQQSAWAAHIDQLQALLAPLAERRASVAPLSTPLPTPIPAPAPAAPQRKRVRVLNMYGGVNEYVFETLPERSDAEAGGAAERASEPRAPDPTFLSLPLVVRSEPGEYLGIAGRAERAFCLNDFLGLLSKSYPPPRHFSVCWTQRQPDAAIWRLDIEQSDVIRPERYSLELEPAVTPKGNQVALLSQLSIDAKDAPTPNLYALIRRMKALVADK